MTKITTHFVCKKCGTTHIQWSGKCANCAAWNSLEASIRTQSKVSEFKTQLSMPLQNLTEVRQSDIQRITTGLSELDKTLGGGLMPGSVILIGGNPGIGKSTLLLQVLANINEEHKVLYVSGEESAIQISQRAKRLNIKTNIALLTETRISHILQIITRIKPVVLVIDSIQTMLSSAGNSIPGSVTQVRDCAVELTQYAKQNNIIMIIIGHVTKDGALAGPRILEHIVDSVLYFQDDAPERYRIIRAIKNRFGSINEASIFAMSEHGLKQVSNPSAIFLSNTKENAPGTMIMVTRAANKSLLLEIQALVSKSNQTPRRISIGIEQNRLSLLLAILHKHTHVITYDQDVFINVVGGIKVCETASDLAVVIAIYSSLVNQTIPRDWICFGELGLTGEVRPVYNGLERLSEAEKQGFKLAIIPKANIPKKHFKKIKIIAISSLSEVFSFVRENL